MRVAFTGKGGSGKTTMAALMARYRAEHGDTVLALDADINQHMAAATGYIGELPNMGIELNRIEQHLIGSRQDISVADMHKTTPPTADSNLVRLNGDDWFVEQYARRTSEGVLIAGAGEIPDGNVGIRCYHGLNGAVELVLGHLEDTPEETVIVDMTAGADVFSSSLFTKVDVLVVVVEPTLKSLSVYDQCSHFSAQHDVPLLVVANKIEHEDDREFINARVDKVVTYLPPSRYVRRQERGEMLPLKECEPEVLQGLESLWGAISSHTRDSRAFADKAATMHERFLASSR